MNNFFIESRDPLFSVIVFFGIIFVITFFSYWWGRYRRKEDFRHLDRFLRQFRSLPSSNELHVMISGGELSEKSWLLLANAYSKNGDYEKSIDIYHEILNLPDSQNSRDTMFLLGKTYFKAGFLKRAEELFLKILEDNPRTPQALNYLLLVYEYMRDYKSAQEVLEPLKELHKDIKNDSIYLKLLSLLNNDNLSNEEKISELVNIYNKNHEFSYMIFEYLFKVNPKEAWLNFDASKSELLTDILWTLDTKDLDLDIISKNSYLRELYTARGDVNLSKKSSVFEFDILINTTKVDATLGFEYICDNCKNVYPFAFNRCSFCHKIDTQRVELNLIRDYYKDFGEENNSFQ